MVDFFSETRDDLGGGPVDVVSSVFGGFLLDEELVQDGDYPVFEEAVIVVWDDEVADAVLSFGLDRERRD